jgi:hypothetical protein
MDLYFKYKFITEIILAGIGIVALIVCILTVIIGAKRKW